MSTPTCNSTPAACAATDCAEVSASARLPVLTLFIGAAFWLVVSSVFALIASVKCHAPGLLADCAHMSYGRVHAAHLNALAYGFAAPAGLGVALWILAQTSKTKLALPGGSFIAALLWNLGVLVGVGSILRGANTGFEFLEFSQAGSVMIFLAYLILALAGVLTFARRAADSNCVSQWFLLGALFWFPWVYTTATALLGCLPVRGVTQALVAWWFANNFLFVWLGLVGIGTIFFFAQKFAARPLHSRQLALFAFWLLIVFGSWAGVPASAPVPAWLPSLSAMGAFLAVTAVLAVVVNLRNTLGQCLCTRVEAVPKFIGLGVWGLLLFTLGRAVTAFSGVAAVTDFTWVSAALNLLGLYGFFGMLMLGAIYHIAPQLTRTEYFCTRPVKIHLWLTFIGSAVLVVALVVAGVKQGRAVNSTASDLKVVEAAMMGFRLSTLGDFLLLLGSLTLVVNLGGLLRACCKLCCGKSQCAEVAK